MSHFGGSSAGHGAGAESDGRKVESESESKNGTHDSRKGFKLMTYNVWFQESVEVVKRMEAIGECIVAEDPDYVLLQEVCVRVYVHAVHVYVHVCTYGSYR